MNIRLIGEYPDCWTDLYFWTIWKIGQKTNLSLFSLSCKRKSPIKFNEGEDKDNFYVFIKLVLQSGIRIYPTAS